MRDGGDRMECLSVGLLGEAGSDPVDTNIGQFFRSSLRIPKMLASLASRPTGENACPGHSGIRGKISGVAEIQHKSYASEC